MFSLYASGSNAHGQLGNGTLDDAHIFTHCIFSGDLLDDNDHKLLTIACGANHTLALVEVMDHRTQLWGCGDGGAGQLGPSYVQGDGSWKVLKPIELALHQRGLDGYSPRLVSASWQTTYVVLSYPGKTDVVVSMGADDFGDLGIGGSRKGKEPARAIYTISFNHLRTADGVQIDHDTLLHVESVAAGQHHVVLQVNAKLGNGSQRYLTVGWGTCRHGQLGDVVDTKKPFLSVPKIITESTEENRVVFAALGSQHTVLYRSSRRVLALGSDRKGQRQGLETLTRVKTVGCTWNGTYVVTDDEDGGHILAAGSHSKGQLGRLILPDMPDTPLLAPVEFPSTSNTHRLHRLACGSEHVLALFSTSQHSETADMGGNTTEVWGWGWNEHGNLGVGSTADVMTPVRIWPPNFLSDGRAAARAIDVWAGPGTSWIATS